MFSYLINSILNTKVLTRTQTEIPQCTGLKRGWDHIKTDQTFPVSKDTVVLLSCNEGYQLIGDSEVTCQYGTQFYYSTTPKCSSGRW